MASDPIELAIYDAISYHVAVGDRAELRRAILAVIDMASAEERESCIEAIAALREFDPHTDVLTAYNEAVGDAIEAIRVRGDEQ